MKEMRRVLALALCFVMLVGVLPVGAFAAEAETAEEQLIEIGSVSKAAADANDDVDFLFVATDRQENTAIIGQLIDAMEDAAQDQLDYLVLGGGMVACEEDSAAYDSSAILAEVTAAADYMTAAKMGIVASAYDKNVNDDAGIVLPYQDGSAEIHEGVRFYVYGVEDNSIAVDFEAEAQKFEDWAAAADSSKAIIVVSHEALHTGNAGAAAWHEALNNVATDDNGNVVRDVIFFHGQGAAEDAAELVYNVGDHMTVDGNEDTICYTYATAGYLSQNGTATLVTIDEGSITLDKFTTGGYEMMTELDRADAEEAVSDDMAVLGVGTDTEIEVPDPGTQSGNGDISETVKKMVYVLASGVSDEGQYLVVNGNSAGSRYALANGGDGSVAATPVTVKTDSEIGTYIELTDATDELWTAYVSSRIQLYNGQYGLLYYNSLQVNESFASNWSYSNNRLSTNNRYLRYDNGWTTTNSYNSASNVYFYVAKEVELEETNTYSGTYSIAGNPAAVSQVGVEGGTAVLSSTLTFTYAGGTKDTVDPAGVEYTVTSDPNGVISGISSNTLTFSGSFGTALVQVSYTGDFGTVTNYITVEAKEPYYTLQLHKYVTADENGDPLEPDDYYVGEEITGPVALKNVSKSTTYDLWAVIKYYDGVADENGEDGVDIGAVDDYNQIRWTVSDPEIADVAAETGELYFTGTKFGTFQVTAQYMDGETILCEDTIVVSATNSPYVVEGDGTDDFPEYPLEGAIRINKTADAVGNFSETGMAKVELSMTGVPYSAGNEIDVIIMLDMSTSMTYATNRVADRVTPARNAAVSALEAIVTNEDGSINNNRVALYTFNGYDSNTQNGVQNYANAVDEVLPMGSYTKDTLTTAKTTVSNWIQDSNTDSGTNYGAALEKCYSVLNAAREEYPERQQFVIFVTDGEPTTGFAYVNSSGGVTDDGYDSDNKNGAADVYYTYTEYYSTQMKAAGVQVYTVGIQLNNTNAYTILEKIAGTKDGNANTGGADYEDYAQFIGANEDAGKLVEIFENIVNAIKEAATNVHVVDKVGGNYTMTFKLPSGVSADKAENMEQFHIQVLEYELDENKERTGEPTVKEKFTFSATTGNVVSHVNDKGITCGTDCSHVTASNGTITAINGSYFQYYVDEKGEEYVTWDEEKISTSELALEYFAYLDRSAGFKPEDQIAAGSYYTNDYAYVTYVNFQGTECQKDFPKPQMTWNGAQVTYLFYLVNEQGNPVNRAGREIPFANAVFVTDPMTYTVTWNELTGEEKMLAKDLLASNNVPDVYELYDTNAYYEVRVYQTESVDENGVNYNFFQIDGSDSISNKKTTKVYNSLAGARYEDYGVYSEQPVGTVMASSNGTVTSTVKTDNIDYGNTTVAFAVVWKPELQPDTVVVDYGLDVVINVITNDSMTAGVRGVMMTAPDAAAGGSYEVPVSVTSITSDDGTWTASWESLEAVRFKQNNMQLKDAAQFYYEAGVTYYESESVIKQTNMYSSVTVIPATTVYYEDTFLTLNSYTAGDDGTFQQDTPSKWELQKDGTTPAGKQEVDRPGVSNIGGAYDGDNEYGNDNGYDAYSTYSLGSAQKITVSEDTYGEATFSFYGTGFDIIGMTSNTTGVLTIQVTGEDGKTRSRMVDTYYGAMYTPCKVTYTFGGKDWYETNVEPVSAMGTPTAIPEGTYEKGATCTIYENRWLVDNSSSGTLYQVPVMKWTDLAYGKYTVKLLASYGEIFDHTTTAGEYDLYLDAIRIYDPTGVVSGEENTTVSNAYLKDGEAYPVYQELRNLILSSATAGANNTSVWNGLIFIDNTKGTKETAYTIADYENYGPNNELYLAEGQAIAFDLVVPANVADVQIGMKSANGSAAVATLALYDVATGEMIANSSAEIAEATSATDRYYSIKKYVPADATAAKTYTISFQNTGDGILSITNIKFTHTSAPASNEIGIGITKDSANTVLKLLNNGAETAAPEVILDADLEVSVRSKSVKVGSNVAVKATTSADVEYLMVNGQKVTKYSENKATGERSWSVNVKADKAGTLDIEVIAYSAEGEILETAAETVEVAAKNGAVKEIVGQLIGMLGR